MLHSGLPRAYVAPLSFFGYYDEASYVQQHQQLYQQQQQSLSPEDSYGRNGEHSSWDMSARSRSETPPPLDLSLKPVESSMVLAREDAIVVDDEEASAAGNEDDRDCEPIEVEVDDEEDRRSREEARSQHSSSESRYYSGASCVVTEDEDGDDNVVVDDLDSQRSCSSAHSYHQLQPQQQPEIAGALSYTEAERLRLAQEMSVAYSPEHHHHHHHQHHSKLMLSPGSHLQNYHQLLQTPQHHHLQATLTPPSTPSPPQCPSKQRKTDASSPVFASPVTTTTTSTSGITTSSSSSSSSSGSKNSAGKPTRAKKKHARKLKFDEEMSSPVSGTVILGPDEAVDHFGDIDPAGNNVVINEKTRAELAKIENKLGPYVCKLCRQLYEDAFKLAQHRCSRIANIDYRCSECEKRFTCPANLASHRRWHKPKQNGSNGSASSSSSSSTTSSTTPESSGGFDLSCGLCDAKFSRPNALKKHMANQHSISSEQNNNNNNNNNNNHQPMENSVKRAKQPQQPQQLTPPCAGAATAMEIA